ncbi:hypothetical protein Patl1_36370 [Pistacia atlantica]|nr:hypothetical protein Patl1_36370 [Pistacia atlantica]
MAAAGIISNLILLFYVFLLMHGIGARTIRTQHLDDDEENNILMVNGRQDAMHGDHHSSSHHHMATEFGLFRMNDLSLGKKMLIEFPQKVLSSSTRFLPREEADLIPFSLNQLPNILNIFSIPHDSPEAETIESTLRVCESEPLQGVSVFCATSLESMVDFAGNTLGTYHLRATTTTALTKSLTGRKQNYTISEVPKEVPVPMLVVCHMMSYPYVVYFCHSLKGESENKLFKVPMMGDNGDQLEGLGICHLKTSNLNFDLNNPGFRMLGQKRGDPFCHFLPTNHVVWVPSS